MVKIVKSGDLGLILVFVIAILIVTAIVSQLWSLSGFVGVCLIFLSIYLVLKRGGNVAVAKNQPYLFFLVLGVMFLFLSYAGFQIIPFEFENPLTLLGIEPFI
jgi:hypothetical protein